MIAIIRIRGQIGLRKEIVETFNRLRLRKKYVCVLVNEKSKEQIGMLKRVKDFVAFGEINDKVLKELVNKRGKILDKNKTKPKADEVVKGLRENKKLEDFNLKSFFRLHPPRKGIKSKLHYPKGVLGDNKEKINDLIMRML